MVGTFANSSLLKACIVWFHRRLRQLVNYKRARPLELVTHNEDKEISCLKVGSVDGDCVGVTGNNLLAENC